MKKLIPILLLLSLLIQSCVVYQKTSVSAQKAYGYGRVKVENNDGTNEKYRNIRLLNGVFNGVKGKTEIPLDLEKIKAFYLEDFSKTRIANVVLILIAIPVVVIGIIFIVAYS